MQMICSFPPPITGQSLVTEGVYHRLLDCGLTVEKIDISPGARRGLFYHLHRLFAVLRAGGRLFRRPRSIIYLSSEAGLGIWYLMYLMICCRVRGNEMVLHHHVFSYIREYSWPHALAVRVGGQRCLHILLSPLMERGFKNRFGGQRRSLILLNSIFIDPQLQRDEPRAQSANPLRVGFIGRLDAPKGFDVFRAVMERLRSDPRFVFLVAGDVAASPYRREIREMQEALKDRLRLCGFVTGAGKQEFFRDIDVLLFPSRYTHEATPMVCYEALAAGCPVCATAVGAVADIVADDCGVVAPLDVHWVDGAVALVERLVADHAYRARLQSAAAARYRHLRERGERAFGGIVDHLNGVADA